MFKVEHVHPMLVHFPIVFLLTAAVIDALIIFIHDGDLSARQCLVRVGLATLLFGTAFAVIAAVFGDMALDIAADKGFDKAPLEEHAGLAGLTIAVFGLLALIQLVAIWRGMRLSGKYGRIFLGALSLGCLLLIVTAYHGGDLVYKLGVNVATTVVKVTPP
ncbi:MAG: DUF2231 domain-containing protein [Gammaproteobacteria bacterium]|nr:DUF2231 domain-containing protein [Gammaproteobacteria bacterium]